MPNGLDELLVDGVLLRREALELGIDDNALSRSVRAGVLHRVRQGAYSDAKAWPSCTAEERHQLLVAAVLRLYGSAVLLSRHSAVLWHGGPSWGLDLRHAHLTYPGANGRAQAGVMHHRGSRRPSDVSFGDGFAVTSPARTVIESALTARSVEVGIVLACDALHRRLTTLDELNAERELAEDHGGALLLRPTLALADGRIESVAEARCWYLLRRHELPEVIPQFEVIDDQGNTLGRVDFVIPELGVIVEFDGMEKYEKHRRPGETVADILLRERRRENQIREATGWTFVRLNWADLHRPQRIIDRIHAAARR